MIALPATDMPPLDTIIHGDCIKEMSLLPDNYVHAVICDPPAGISFMGKSWDKDKGGRDMWIAWLAMAMKEALRVTRPGGHALVWALPRTSHWTGMALEQAGWEIRDCIVHMFGSGFPKSLDISKAIDKQAGKERTETEWYDRHYDGITRNEQPSSAVISFGCHGQGNTRTKPVTDEAQHWQGWGSALKPSAEYWWLCRKPLAESTLAGNVLAWECGGINIDACRINVDDKAAFPTGTISNTESVYGNGKGRYDTRPRTPDGNPSKRFPANTLLSHSLWCTPRGVQRVRVGGGQPIEGHERKTHNVYGDMVKTNSSTYHGDADGMETVAEWECAEGCPVLALGRQSGKRKSGGPFYSNDIPRKEGFLRGMTAVGDNRFAGDEGAAARYFEQFPPDLDAPFLYTSKASRRERNAGCEGLPVPDSPDAHNLSSNACARCGMRVKSNGSGNKCECGPLRETIKLPPPQNTNPCVKPLALMSWLCRLVTPPGGIVLDPFAGSGSTLCAAISEGMHYIGIEQDAEYVAIAEARVAHALRETGRGGIS